MGFETREWIGRPLLSNLQNGTSSQGAPRQDPYISLQSHKGPSSHLPAPDAFSGFRKRILPWSPNSPLLRGEGDSLAEVGAVVELMVFHRLNLGFLAHKEHRRGRD